MVLQSRNRNFNFYRGDTLSWPIEITRNGAVEDITGWTFFLTIKTAITDGLDDAGAVVQVNVTAHTDAANGLSLVEVSAATLNTLSGEYFYDLQYKDDAGKIVTLMYGKMNFDRDVTRRTS